MTGSSPRAGLQPIRIFGAGVRGSLVADLIAWQFADRFAVDGFYDDAKPVGAAGPSGAKVLGSVAQGLSEVATAGVAAFVAIGTLRSARAVEILRALQRSGAEIASLVPPAALVSPSARIGVNALVMPGVFVGAHVRIGDLFVAHGGAVVEHDAMVGDNVLFGPTAAVASAVHVGSHTFLGAGCSAIPLVQIGRGVLIGAGAAVTREIPSFVIAAGVPARIIRQVREGDEVPTESQIAALEALASRNSDGVRR